MKGRPVAGLVEGKPAFRNSGAATRAAKHGLDAGNNLARAEGLADVVVGSQLQAEETVDLFDPGRDHDDRN